MLNSEIFKFHSKSRGKLATQVTTPIKNKKDLALAYTPGVAQVCLEIHKNEDRVFDYTIKPHTVAVVSDGSAVLGLGNIGAKAAIPVMEGKAALFKTFGGVDAFPICLETQDSREIINTVKLIAPVFGGVNLEDIAAPRCFEIEEQLQNLGIPVMHDDQHGTAVVTLAGLINASKVVDKNMNNLTVVINGAGAAGQAIARLLKTKVKNIIVVDSKGIISRKRKDLDKYKLKLLDFTNSQNISGTLSEALKGADVFIGVSKGNLLNANSIGMMNKDAIVFAMANPIPEIMPDEARKGGAKVAATGRSDLANQINNSLAFPGIFKGALSCRADKITEKMKFAAAESLANMVKNPTSSKIVPGPFDKGVADRVAKAVVKAFTNK